MATVYYPVTYVKAYLNSAWVDISNKVMFPFKAMWGVSGNSPDDRIARTGSIEFTFDNSGREFTPGSSTMYTGWSKGSIIVFDISFDDLTYRRFKGKVDEVDPDGGRWSERRVRVKVVDWMNIPMKGVLTNPQIVADQTPGVVIQDILDRLPVAPDTTTIDTGIVNIPQAYDSTTSETKGYSELSKIADAEVGYVYLRKDKTYGEHFVFEGAHHRKGTDTLTQVAIPKAEAYLLDESDNQILDNNDLPIIVWQTPDYVDAELNGLMHNELKTMYGKDLVNKYVIRGNSKTNDTSAQVLFSLEGTIRISANTGFIAGAGGSNKSFRGVFKDSAGNEITAVTDSMLAPVSTTDYLFNTAEDGSGTDITNYLNVVATYDASGVDYRFISSYGSTGWIIHLQARGLGIYNTSALEYKAINQTSITEYGEFPENLSQDYQQDLTYGGIKAEYYVEIRRLPRHDLKSVTFICNKSQFLMQAMLQLDVGDLVYIRDTDADVSTLNLTQSVIDGWYHIQGVTLNVINDGIIEVTWNVKQHFSLYKGLTGSEIHTEQTGVDEVSPALSFGQLPYLWNITQRSWSVWVYPTSIDAADNTILSMLEENAGWKIYLTNNATPRVGLLQKGAVADGIYLSPTDSITLDAINHIVITRDSSTPANQPVITINGSPVAVTVSQAQSGAIPDETGLALVMNNHPFKATGTAFVNALNGYSKDARIFSNILLTADNATALYAAGAGAYAACESGLEDYLEFQGACYLTDREADYWTSGGGYAALAQDRNFIDNIHGAIGRALGVGASAGLTYVSQPDGTDGIDTHIKSTSASTNYGTNTVLIVGDDGSLPNDDYRALIKFDLTKGLNPPASTDVVVSAVLNITPVADDAVVGGTYQIYRVRRDWVEAEATWNIWKTANNWTTAGCGDTTNDREADLIGSVTLGAAQTLNVGIDIQLDAFKVQQWVSGVFGNYGILIKSADEGTAFRYSFASSDHATAGYRPKLTIVVA